MRPILCITWKYVKWNEISYFFTLICIYKLQIRQIFFTIFFQRHVKFYIHSFKLLFTLYCINVFDFIYVFEHEEKTQIDLICQSILEKKVHLKKVHRISFQNNEIKKIHFKTALILACEVSVYLNHLSCRCEIFWWNFIAIIFDELHYFQPILFVWQIKHKICLEKQIESLYEWQFLVNLEWKKISFNILNNYKLQINKKNYVYDFSIHHNIVSCDFCCCWTSHENIWMNIFRFQCFWQWRSRLNENFKYFNF